ncbi:uncharacterized protein LOC111259310 isoform X2 [Varroa jacobsoni]|uniref:uncharacterized protein LOC111259310 isoform X2 n=1 Tax=Varroa jacobsoni TaxID=62625 RepID=UPI000BF4C7A2|nr:uncharacterized protein LOC111259310 isoform X2 [Varroa jacobsoni]
MKSNILVSEIITCDWYEKCHHLDQRRRPASSKLSKSTQRFELDPQISKGLFVRGTKQKYLNPETRTSQTIPNRYKAPEFKKNPHLSEKGESSRQLNREKHELSRNNSKQLIRFDSEQPGSPFVVKLEDGQLEDVNAVVYTPQITHGQSRSPKGSLLPVKGGSLRNPDRKRLPTSSKGQESNFQLLKDCSEDGQPVKELNAKMVTRQTIRNRSEVPELACRSSRDRSPANGVPSEDCDRELHETRTITQSVKLFRVSSQPSTALKIESQNRAIFPSQPKDPPRKYRTGKRSSAESVQGKNASTMKRSRLVQEQMDLNQTTEPVDVSHSNDASSIHTTGVHSFAHSTAKPLQGTAKPMAMTVITTSVSTTSTTTKKVVNLIEEVTSELIPDEMSSSDLNDSFKRMRDTHETINTHSSKDTTTSTMPKPNLVSQAADFDSTRKTAVLSSSVSNGNTSFYKRVPVTRVSGAGTLIFSCEKQVRRQRKSFKGSKGIYPFKKDSLDQDSELLSDILQKNKKDISSSELMDRLTSELDSMENKTSVSTASISRLRDLSNLSVASMKSSTATSERPELPNTTPAISVSSERYISRDITANSGATIIGRCLLSNDKPFHYGSNISKSSTILETRNVRREYSNSERPKKKASHQINNHVKSLEGPRLTKASQQSPAQLKSPKAALVLKLPWDSNDKVNHPKSFPMPYQNRKPSAKQLEDPNKGHTLPVLFKKEDVGCRQLLEEQDVKCSNLADFKTNALTDAEPNHRGKDKITMGRGGSFKVVRNKDKSTFSSRERSDKASKSRLLSMKRSDASIVRRDLTGLKENRDCKYSKSNRSCKHLKNGEICSYLKSKRHCKHSKNKRACKYSKNENICKHRRDRRTCKQSKKSQARRSRAGKSSQTSNEKIPVSNDRYSKTTNALLERPMISQNKIESKNSKKGIFSFSKKISKGSKLSKPAESDSQDIKGSRASSGSFKISLKKWFSKKTQSQKNQALSDDARGSMQSSGNLEGGSNSAEKNLQPKRSPLTSAKLSPSKQAPNGGGKSPPVKLHDQKEGQIAPALRTALTAERGEAPCSGMLELGQSHQSGAKYNAGTPEKHAKSSRFSKSMPKSVQLSEDKQVRTASKTPLKFPESNASPVPGQSIIPSQHSNKDIADSKVGDDSGVRLNSAQSDGPASRSSKASYTERQRYLRALEKLVDVISISTKSKAEDQTRDLLQEMLIKEGVQEPIAGEASHEALFVGDSLRALAGKIGPPALNKGNSSGIPAEITMQKCSAMRDYSKIPLEAGVQETVTHLNENPRKSPQGPLTKAKSVRTPLQVRSQGTSPKGSSQETRHIKSSQRKLSKTGFQGTPLRDRVLRTVATGNIHELATQRTSKEDTVPKGLEVPAFAVRHMKWKPAKLNPSTKQKSELRVRTNRTSYPIDTNQKDSSTPTNLRDYAMGNVNAPLDNLVDPFRRLECSSYSSPTYECLTTVAVRGGSCSKNYPIICDKGYRVTSEYVRWTEPNSRKAKDGNALSIPPVKDIRDHHARGSAQKCVGTMAEPVDVSHKLLAPSDPAAGEAAQMRRRREGTKHEFVSKMQKISPNSCNKCSLQADTSSSNVSKQNFNYNTSSNVRSTPDRQLSRCKVGRRSASMKGVCRPCIRPRNIDQESRITEVTTMGTPTSMQLSDHTIFTSTRDAETETGSRSINERERYFRLSLPSDRCYSMKPFPPLNGRVLNERPALSSNSEDCSKNGLAIGDARRHLLFKYLAKSMYCHVIQERDPNVGVLQSCAIELDQRTGLMIIPAPVDSTRWFQMYKRNLALLSPRNIIVAMAAHIASAFCDKFYFRPMAIPLTYVVIPPKYVLFSSKVKGVRISLYKPKYLQNWTEWDFAALGLQRSVLLQYLARNMDTFLALRGATVVGHCLVERLVGFCEEASLVRELVAENDEIAIKLLKHARKNKRLRGTKDKGMGLAVCCWRNSQVVRQLTSLFRRGVPYRLLFSEREPFTRPQTLSSFTYI